MHQKQFRRTICGTCSSTCELNICDSDSGVTSNFPIGNGLNSSDLQKIQIDVGEGAVDQLQTIKSIIYTLGQSEAVTDKLTKMWFFGIDKEENGVLRYMKE